MDKIYESFVKILHEELKPAMGCTEPIAISYAASIVKKVLGKNPKVIDCYVSGNILKNVKSVTVPNTNGLHGIASAIAVGVLGGDPTKELEVIADVTDDVINQIPEYIENTKINIKDADNNHTLYIEIIGRRKSNYCRCIIQDAHTNVVLVEMNESIIFEKEDKTIKLEEKTDKSILSIERIVDFAKTVDISKVKDVLDRQIKYNMAISEEGLNKNFGANIGKTIIKYGSKDVVTYCKALAASGSDARMNGCDMPVVINSGSGNQGLTASVPVIAYARWNKLDDEKLYRALIISNLCTIHIKNSIGKLSAFCGVVIAGCGCGAGISYLDGGGYTEIAHTIVNSLAIVSGMLCDGAKSSCAAKIASSVEAGILGYYMYKDGNEFVGGDGIIKRGVENTIKAIGTVARVGMCQTDKEIIQLMIEK